MEDVGTLRLVCRNLNHVVTPLLFKSLTIDCARKPQQFAQMIVADSHSSHESVTKFVQELRILSLRRPFSKAYAIPSQPPNPTTWSYYDIRWVRGKIIANDEGLSVVVDDREKEGVRVNFDLGNSDTLTVDSTTLWQQLRSFIASLTSLKSV